MGLFDFVGKQFVDVIDWVENEEGVLAYRYPMSGREIQNGAKLTVRETQAALFVNEGTVADLFGPGLHTLSTNTLPILTYLQNWDKAFQSPFKSDLYFFGTRQQLNQKWGTPSPITVRDKEFGIARIRAYGIYNYQLNDPKLFHTKVSGTREIYRTSDLEGQLLGNITANLASALGTQDVPFLDMAANQMKFSEALTNLLAPSFSEFGLKLNSLQVQSISLPEELQKKLDERASMGIVGDLGAYTRFQTAQSIPIAAANEGGLAGAGAGIGAGVAMGQAMSQALQGSFSNPGGGSALAEDPLKTIEKLRELVTKGILSKEEFEVKKAELLKKIS